MTTASAPTLSSATAGNQSIALAWTAPASTGGLNIPVIGYVITATSSNPTVVITLSGTSTTYVLSGLSPAVAYSVSVAALTPSGTGAASNALSATPYAPPSAPGSLSATTANQSISLSWTAPSSTNGSAITGYVVRISTDGGVTWTQAATTAAGVTSTTVSSLVNGTTYNVEVLAQNAAGLGAPSSILSVTPVTTASAPTSLVSVGGSGSLTVTFAAPADNGGAAIVRYLVEFRELLASTWTIGAAVTSPQSVLLTGLQGGLNYLVRVTAVNQVGPGTPAVASSALVTSVPTAPLNVGVVNGDGQVDVTWSPPSLDGGQQISEYLVWTSTDGGVTWAAPVTLGPATTSTTLTGLVDGTTYWVKVTARNAVGESPASPLVVATPIPTLTAPTGLIATGSDATVTLSWAAPTLTTTLPISGYQIAVCSTHVPCGAGDVWRTYLSTAPVPATSAVLTGLANGTTYTMAVAVIVAGNVGPYSTSTLVMPAAPPSPPINLVVTPSDGQLGLSWAAPLSTGGVPVAGYDVEISVDGGVTWTTATSAGVALTGISRTTATIDGAIVGGGTVAVVNGVTYLVRLRASNSVGAGTFGGAVAATPAVVPGAPTALQAVNGPLSVLLSWTPPTKTGGFPITGWAISWIETGGSNASGSLQTTNGAPFASISGLEPQLYTFAVAAVTATGIGAGVTVTGTPLPGAPISPIAMAGDTAVTLNWNAPSGITGHNYVVERSIDGGLHWSTVTANIQESMTGTSWTPCVGGTINGSATWARVLGLTNGNTQVLRVVIRTSGGATSLPSAVVVAVPAGAPGAPGALTILPGDGQAVVSWSASNPNGAPLTGYLVSLSTDGTTWTQVATTDLTSVVLSGLINGTTYYVAVVATNAALGGATSAPATGTTMPIGLPGTPRNVIATPTATGTDANITWAAPASTGGTGVALTNYLVSYSGDGGATWSTPRSVTTPRALLTGLTPGITYLVRVAAANAAGTGPWSGAISFIPVAPPGAPSGLSVTPKDSGTLLTWVAPTNTGGSAITGYEIDVCLGAASSCTSWTVAVVNTQVPVTTWPVSGLTNGTLTSFRVLALSAGGAGPASSVASTIPSGVPTAPSGLTATPGDAQITLNWTPGAANGSAISSYLISSTSDGGATWTTSRVTGTSATITGLVNGATYAFRVSAVNAEGVGVGSDLVTSSPWTRPSAPQSPVITPADTAAVLTWAPPASDGGAAVSGYLIQELFGSTWTNVATTTGTARSATITGLTNGVDASFRVLAVNEAGTGSPTATLIVHPAGLPTVPTGLSATPGDRQVILNWIPPSNDGGDGLSGYVVQVSFDNGARWSNSITVACTLTPASLCAALDTYTVTALTGGGYLANGALYTFRVAAVNAAGQSPWSMAVAATPAGPAAPPASFSAIGIDPGATLTWNAPVDTGGAPILGYIVSWRIVGSTNQPSSIATPTVATTYVIQGLEAGVAYEFFVSAVTAAGVGTASLPATAIPFDVPAAPQSLTVTSLSSSIQLTWTHVSSDNGSVVTGYQVTQSNDGITWTVVANVSGINTLSTTIRGLTNGQMYSFRVAAVNAAGPGAPTNVVAAAPAAVPSAPGRPTINVTSSSLSLSWTAPASDGGSPVSAYQVWLSANGATATLGASSSVTNVTITGLPGNVTYTAYVVAINAAGSSAHSPTATALTATTSVPSAPLALVSTTSAGTVQLSWTAPSSTGGTTVTGYKIYSSNDGGLTWTLVTTVSGLNTTVSSLVLGTTYSFEVFAVNAVGTGSGSNVVAATLNALPVAPTGLVATPGAQSLAVSWNAASDPVGGVVTGYKVEYSSDGSSWTVAAARNVVTSMTIGSLVPGTNYYVRVSTVATTGTSTPSASILKMPINTPGVALSLVTTTGNGSVQLTWAAPSGAVLSEVTAYSVSWCQGTCGVGAVWTVAATVILPATLSATVSGLVNGAIYHFEVRAINAVGSGPAATGVATPAGPSAAPQLTTLAGGQLALQATWSAPTTTNGAAVTTYRVLIQDPSTSLWVLGLGASGPLSTVAGLSTTITGYGSTTSLTAGRSYMVSIVANSSAGQSPASAPLVAAPYDVAGTPTGLVANSTSHQVRLDWVAPSTTGGVVLTGYRILSVGVGNVLSIVVNSTNSLDTTWTLTGLSNGTRVTYVVEALNAAGASAASASAAATPAAPPSAVTGITASTGTTTATLQWTAPAANGAAITGYTVLISSDGGVTYFTATGATESLSSVAGTSAMVVDLTPGRTYLFSVVATNSAGPGAPSAPVSVTVAVVLGVPTNLRAVVGDTLIGLSWTAAVQPATTTLTGYRVEQSLDGVSWTVLSDSTNSTGTSYQVNGLTDGTQYLFRVSAVTTAGLSAPSNAASGVPVGLPGAPTSLDATSVTSGVRLSWTTPATSGGVPITGYRIQSSADGSVWTTIVFSTASTTTATVVQYSGTTPIQYRVAAINVSGLSSWSMPVTYAPPVPVTDAPTNLRIATQQGTTLVLAWTRTPGSTSTRIEQSSDGGVTWVQVLTTTKATASISGLTLGVGYGFRVVAIASGIPSTPSSQIFATISLPPSAPQKITVIAGNGAAKITWIAPSVTNGAAITSYVIQIAQPGGSFVTVSRPDAAALSAILSNLTNETTYLIRIAAVNASGTGAFSASLTVIPNTKGKAL